MNKAKAFIHHISNGNPQVFGAIMISAVLITIFRIFAIWALGWDQSSQLSAAHRLVNGLGLTEIFCNISPEFHNINVTPSSRFLTWFPPGFSLLVAGFLFLKIPLILALKFIYSVSTLIGWFNWAIVASYLLSNSIYLGSISVPLQLAIAAVMPFIYTPSWGGTDIMLWGAVPAVILLLLNSGEKKSQAGLYVALAGLIFGLVYFIRYASLYVALVAFLILLRMHFKRPISFVKSFIIFLFSALVVMVPVSIYNNLAGKTAGGLAPYLDFSYGLAHFGEIITKMLGSAPTLTTLIGIPPALYAGTGVILRVLKEQFAPVNYLYGFLCIIFFVLVIPSVIIKYTLFGEKSRRNDLIANLAILITSMAAFLLVSIYTFSYDYLGDTRHYTSTGPAGMLIIYQLATRKANYQWLNKLNNTAIYGLILLCAIGAIWAISGMLLLVATPQNEAAPVVLGKKLNSSRILQPILGWHYPLPPGMAYPSNEMVTEHPETWKAVREIKQKNPGSIFYIKPETGFHYYVYDGYNEVRCLPSNSFWQQAYVEKPVRLFWLVESACSDKCISGDNTQLKIFEQLSQQPGLLKTVAKFPNEKTKILMSDLPQGFKFSQ